MNRHRTNRPPSFRRTSRIAIATILLATLGLAGAAPSAATSGATSTVTSGADEARHGLRPTIVLVHGAFADASGWGDVIRRLQSQGYPTLAPANPLRGLPSDTDYIKSVLEFIEGPIVLVGHSYGGMVMTNAAAGDPDVVGLVYVAAFAPAEGDTVEKLSFLYPGSMLIPDNLDVHPYPPTVEGAIGYEGYIKTDVFREVFAGDLPRRITEVMAVSQRPAELASLQQPSGPPAWASIPSWFVVAENDNAIPADAQRFMAERAGAVKTVEVGASHVVMMSKPAAVTALITAAAGYQG